MKLYHSDFLDKNAHEFLVEYFSCIDIDREKITSLPVYPITRGSKLTMCETVAECVVFIKLFSWS